MDPSLDLRERRVADLRVAEAHIVHVDHARVVGDFDQLEDPRRFVVAVATGTLRQPR